MYETFQSRALTSYKRLSWSQIDGEAAHLVGVAGGALGDLLIRVPSDALMMTLTVSPW
jgi:hypothetical protein